MSNRNVHSPPLLSAVKAGHKPFPGGFSAAGLRAMGRGGWTGGSASSASPLAAFFLARRAEAIFSRSGTGLAPFSCMPPRSHDFSIDPEPR
jgi:hypothetical protein